MDKPSHWIRRAALMAFGIFAGLILAELFLRFAVPYKFIYKFNRFLPVDSRSTAPKSEIADSLEGIALLPSSGKKCYGLRPDFHARMESSEYSVDYRTNNLGLRNRPIKKKAGPRILGLGDSFAMGYGVEAEQAFLSLLEKYLKSKLEPDVEVVNAGVMGYSPYNSYFYFIEEGVNLEPDLVILQMWAGNTIFSADRPSCPNLAIDASAMDRMKSLALKSHLGMFLIDRLRSAALARKWLLDRGILARFDVPDRLDVHLGERSAERIASFDEMLSRLKSFCVERNIRLVLFLVPLREQVYPELFEKAVRYNLADVKNDEVDFDAPNKIIRRLAENNGIEFIDPLPVFRQNARDRKLYFERYDPHFTPAGHHLAAEVLLAPAMKELSER